jgi:hypothetical protein
MTTLEANIMAEIEHEPSIAGEGSLELKHEDTVASSEELFKASSPSIDGQEDDEELAVDNLTSSHSSNDVEKYLEHHEKTYIGQQQTRREQIQQWLVDTRNVPQSYYTNSAKEILLLQYADNFIRQYTQLYPGRKELLLSPPNEFGIKKFISSTIRPTQLPFKEVYDYRTCAAFVSEFVTYKLLGYFY